MKALTMKALVVTAMAGSMTFGASGIAAAAKAGDTVTGRANASHEGMAYHNALTEARNQCPNRNNVSPARDEYRYPARKTWQEDNGTWGAYVRVVCN